MKRSLWTTAACVAIGLSGYSQAADQPAAATESKPTAVKPIPPAGPSAAVPSTQPAARARVKSPEVGPDRKVTVRLVAPKATSVACESTLGRFPMTKGDDGVWSVTFGPLEPDVYDYGFNVDGLRICDPINPAAKTPTVSFLPIPGDPPATWELRNVPHGKVQFHWYHSKSLGIERRLHIYTPPGYDAASDTKYPVLYLLHGSGDDDAGWVNIGRADLIFDNLLAEGKMKPMVVVMPEGHTPQNPPGAPAAPPAAAPPSAPPTDPATVKPNSLTAQGTPGAAAAIDRNTAFTADLMSDVMPLVESSYHVKTDAAHRAISGLSMGGGQSLRVSLEYPEKFAYVALMSSGFRGQDDLDRAFPEAAAKLKAAPPFKLFWIGCGSKDRLLAASKKIDEWCSAHGVKHEFHESEGAHEWRVWRRNLITIAPMLFAE